MADDAKMKYITYRADRDAWQVRFRGTSGRMVTRSFKSLDEAITYRDKFINVYELDKKIVVPRKPLTKAPTFSRAFDIYIEEKALSLKPATIQHLTTTRNFLIKYIADIPIDELTEWQRFFVKLQETKDVGYDYLTKKIRQVREMYDFFIKKGVIKSNPLEGVRLANFDGVKNRRRAFSEEEKQRFLDVCRSCYPQWLLLFEMYFQTGCRRGELLAVTFNDIDFSNKVLHIYKNVARGQIKGNYSEMISEPKTKGSVRDVPLSQTVVTKIEKIKREKDLQSDAYVFSFTENHSKWIAIDAVTQTFIKIREKAELPKNLTLHCTRHTFASTLLTKGVDYATVAELGGWSSAAVLMAIYAHSNNDKKQEVMRKFMFDE